MRSPGLVLAWVSLFLGTGANDPEDPICLAQRAINVRSGGALGEGRRDNAEDEAKCFDMIQSLENLDDNQDYWKLGWICDNVRHEMQQLGCQQAHTEAADKFCQEKGKKHVDVDAEEEDEVELNEKDRNDDRVVHFESADVVEEEEDEDEEDSDEGDHEGGTVLRVSAERMHAIGDVTEQILGLFGDNLPERAKAQLRERDLIPVITKWMRDHSNWDGFAQVDDVSFWRAQQEALHTTNPKYQPQWWGQPSKKDPSTPLRMSWEMNRWFRVLERQTLFWDVEKEMLGVFPNDTQRMHFNWNLGLQFFENSEEAESPDFEARWSDPYEEETKKLLAEERLFGSSWRNGSVEYSPYLDPGLRFKFKSFNKTINDGRFVGYNKRTGVRLEGPGYIVDFISIWRADRNGQPEIRSSTVACMAVLDDNENKRIDLMARKQKAYGDAVRQENSTFSWGHQSSPFQHVDQVVKLRRNAAGELEEDK